MSKQLLVDVGQFLEVLQATQQELLTHLNLKRVALTGTHPTELISLAGPEAELIHRMHALLERREKILQRARNADLQVDSIKELAHLIGGDRQQQLSNQIDKAAYLSLRLRQENWIHWIISHRAYNHYTELLNLIANCGEKAPTYSKGQSVETTGGAILDTSI